MGIEAAILGAGILGAGSSIVSSNRAAGAVENSSAASTAEQRRQFDTVLGLQRPAIDAGNTARDQLMRLLGLTPSGGSSSVTPSSGFSDIPTDTTGLGGMVTRLINEIRGDGLGRTNEGGGLPANLRQQLGLDSQGLGGQSVSSGASSDPLDVIRNTPGYNFQLEQGARALNANRSAGGVSGGELLKDFARFNQGVASSFYQDYANRLANLAGTGQTASTSAGNAALITGQNVGNNLITAGNARASGILGGNNAFTGLLSDLSGAAGLGLFSGGSNNLTPWQSAVDQG